MRSLRSLLLVLMAASCGDESPGSRGGDGGSICQPQCAGRSCGQSDNCGGSCSACPAGLGCASGRCVPAAWSQVAAPTTNLLWDVWGHSHAEVWAVGERGTILQYDGAAWQTMRSPTMSAVYGIWGTASDNLWAVGSEAPAYSLMHYDGVGWMGFIPYPTRATLTSVWGSAVGDIWAVGIAFGEAAILHYQDGRWTAVTKTTTPDNGGLVIQGGLAHVWGSSAADVWAAGEAGLYHFDGSAWSPYAPPPTPDIIRALHGSAASDVWIVAEAREVVARTIYHFDGARWSQVAYPEGGYITDLWSAAPNDVWAVGEGPSGGIFHFDGAAWTVPPAAAAAARMSGIFGLSPVDIWAVADEGKTWHYAAQ